LSSNVPTLRAVGAGEVVGVSVGTVKHVYNDGTNVRFVNLPDVGVYWDWCGSAVPGWVSLCTVPPFLVCDGSGFNAVTYPVLAAVLGSAVLPDFRGRNSFYLNGGTGRLTAAGAGIDGNTRFASGGSDGVGLTVNQIPAGVPSTNAGVINVSVSSTNLVISNPSGAPSFADLSGAGGQVTAWGLGALTSHLASTGSFVANAVNVTSTNGAQALVHSTTPGVVGGIRMIRAG
jgi:hypothetical protein